MITAANFGRIGIVAQSLSSLSSFTPQPIRLKLSHSYHIINSCELLSDFIHIKSLGPTYRIERTNVITHNNVKLI